MSRLNVMKPSGVMLVIAVLGMTIVAPGCRQPQELPVVVSRAAGGSHLEWRDDHGPLGGEVPCKDRTGM